MIDDTHDAISLSDDYRLLHDYLEEELGPLYHQLMMDKQAGWVCQILQPQNLNTERFLGAGESESYEDARLQAYRDAIEFVKQEKSANQNPLWFLVENT